MRVRREVLQNAGRMEEADGVHVGTDGSDRRWARDQVKISSPFPPPFSKLCGNFQKVFNTFAPF